MTLKITVVIALRIIQNQRCHLLLAGLDGNPLGTPEAHLALVVEINFSVGMTESFLISYIII